MNEYIKFSLYNIIRSKKNIVNTIIISVLICLIFILINSYVTVHNYLDNDINKGYNNRTLSVNKSLENASINDVKQIEKEIQSINHVQSSFLDLYATQGATISEFSGLKSSGIEFTAANNDSLLKIVKGKKFPNDDGYYMICPINFYPNFNYNEFKNLTSKDKFQLNKKIDKEFTVNVEDWVTKTTSSFKVKLIGLYQNQANQIDENMCFVSRNVNEKIAFTYFGNDKTWSLDQYSSFITVVDDINNLDKVSNQLTQLGYDVKPIVKINYDYFNNIFNVIKIIFVGLCLLTIAFFTFFLIKDYFARKKYDTLLRVLGYNEKQLAHNYFIEVSIRILLSCILSILLTFILSMIIKIIISYKPFILNKWTIIINYKYYIYLYLLLLIICIIIYLVYNFVKNRKSIEINL